MIKKHEDIQLCILESYGLEKSHKDWKYPEYTAKMLTYVAKWLDAWYDGIDLFPFKHGLNCPFVTVVNG